MRPLAAVLCHDIKALPILKATLNAIGIEPVSCRSHQEAIELVLEGRCAALIADFDLPGVAEVVKTASLLVPPQKPLLLAMAGAWPGTGQAFQSGASRILYKPLQPDQLRNAFERSLASKRKKRARAPRYKMRSLAYLELHSGPMPAIGINLSEQGMAIRAAERITPLANVPFRCILPGTRDELHGHADVIWADEQGRAGILFSRLSPSAQKLLKDWLRKCGKSNTRSMRMLLPSTDTAVFANSRDESSHRAWRGHCVDLD
jgi:CheY-like chemotaxis protein